jgi:hypothetical protein
MGAFLQGANTLDEFLKLPVQKLRFRIRVREASCEDLESIYLYAYNGHVRAYCLILKVGSGKG